MSYCMYCLECHLMRNINHMVSRYAEINGKRERIGFVCKKCLLKELKRGVLKQGLGQPTPQRRSLNVAGKESK